jgi:hypothetical protein
LRSEDFVGDNAIPNRIESRGGKYIIACIRSQVKVVKSELGWVPEEVQDTRTNASSDLEMGAGCGRVGRAIKLGKKYSGLVCRSKFSST